MGLVNRLDGVPFNLTQSCAAPCKMWSSLESARYRCIFVDMAWSPCAEADGSGIPAPCLQGPYLVSRFWSSAATCTNGPGWPAIRQQPLGDSCSTGTLAPSQTRPGASSSTTCMARVLLAPLAMLTSSAPTLRKLAALPPASASPELRARPLRGGLLSWWRCCQKIAWTSGALSLACVGRPKIALAIVVMGGATAAWWTRAGVSPKQRDWETTSSVM